MCGVIGAFPVRGEAFAEVLLRAALDRMKRRGPDAEGFWIDEGVALGHRRLAIIDLDARAAQPMHSIDGRYVIVFNGEIYNYRSLRGELEAAGTPFRTTSDTEVILALFAECGEAMLRRLHGMFAFVIWDRVKKRAFMARDPYGIKPLYYAGTAAGALVASQVKALLATGLVSREPDVHGQAGFWMLGSVPEPRTWFRDVRALPAGHFAWIDEGHVAAPVRWHDIGEAWRVEPSERVPDAEVREGVRSALCESVARHLVSDVPVGVFLSGGIDSGALAGLMVDAGARSLEGVTLAYDEFRGRPEDEAPVAARIAAHYGIRHHVRYPRCDGPAEHRRDQHLVCEQGCGGTGPEGRRIGRGRRRTVPGLRELSRTTETRSSATRNALDPGLDGAAAIAGEPTLQIYR